MVKQYIGGKLVEGQGRRMKVYNPANNEVITEFGGASREQALEALDCAKRAFPKWSRETTIDERVGWLRRLFEALKEEKDHIQELLMAESGKTYALAEEDWNLLAINFNFYAEEIRRVYGTSIQPGDKNHMGNGIYNIVGKRPLGVVVSYMAWNYPLFNASLKLCPALVSGCTCVLKPSSETPLATLYIGEVAARIGLPEGVVNIISGPSSEVGAALNSSRIPKMITLIGSDDTARTIVKESSTSIKKYSFELGGIAPVIVCEDADHDLAADMIIAMKTANTGQICTAYNRIYVHESIYDSLSEKILERLKKQKLGSGRDEGEVIGPMINRAARDRMLDLIDDAVSKGATLVYGGTVPEEFAAGNYIVPALLKDASNDMRVFQEETFGPIIPLCRYSDFDDALRMSVEGDYGLSSYLYTHDSRKIAYAYEMFESGEVIVNGAPTVTYNTPHVGARQSGVGCDGSFWSLDEYFQLKRLSMVP